MAQPKTQSSLPNPESLPKPDEALRLKGPFRTGRVVDWLKRLTGPAVAAVVSSPQEEVNRLVSMELEKSIEQLVERVITLKDDEWNLYRGLFKAKNSANAAALVTAGNSVRQGLKTVNQLVTSYRPAQAAQIAQGMIAEMDDVERFGFAQALRWEADNNDPAAQAILEHLRRLLIP